MTYERFERLVLVVGGLATIGAMGITVGHAPVLEELAGQVLLLVVVLAAVHYGRKGGFTAAAGASLMYFMLRVPTVMAEGGLNTTLALLLGSRILAYGVIGIVGGEVFSRIKYVFAGLEDAAAIDEWTRVYNQATIIRSAVGCHGQHVRYDNPYSIILISLIPQLTAELRPSRQRMLLRRVADLLRTDVRLVDEVGRLDDGRFMLVLPQTQRAGAMVAAERLRTGVREMLGARDESVSVDVLGTPEDSDSLAALLDALSPHPVASGQPSDTASVA